MKLLTEKEQDELKALKHRRLYGFGERLTKEELIRYDQLLTKQAEEDYQKYWTDRNVDKEEAIKYLKAKLERDCLVP